MWLSTAPPIPYHCLLDHQHHETCKNVAALSFCRAASRIYSFIQIITWRWVAFTDDRLATWAAVLIGTWLSLRRHWSLG